MTEEGGEQAYALLANHHMARQGLEIKLDRGFATGSYAVWVEYDQLAARVGFAAARRVAREYCALLKSHLKQASTNTPGKTEDLSRSDDPRHKRDLEGTFLSFVIETDDGRYHDDTMRKDFQLALLRTGQAWDQAQAKLRDRQYGARQDRFREQLAELLEGADNRRGAGRGSAVLEQGEAARSEVCRHAVRTPRYRSLPAGGEGAA